MNTTLHSLSNEEKLKIKHYLRHYDEKCLKCQQGLILYYINKKVKK